MPESDLARRFLALELRNHGFTHRNHVEVAYDLLKAHGFVEATTIYASTILVMATRDGTPEKFNTTITFAFMSLIAEQAGAATYRNFDEFIAENPDLLDKNVLNYWYTNERLHSEKARRAFVLPDRIAQSGRTAQ